MHLLTKEDLKSHTDAELWELYRRLLFLLSTLREGSLDHLNTLMNLQLVRERLSDQYRLRPG